MAARKKPVGPTPVEATTHADTRVNIPTGELAGFVADEEKAPTDTLYPRDPTLDPQLVWKGKDAQDLAEHLAVASVPVYIQEKVDPRALVENLRATAAVAADEPELRLFDDFDGLEFDDLVDFYRHEGNWSNRMILGDSLLVMNSLATKERMAGKVQMVFLDPPYGISFGSNWQVSTRKRDVKDGKDTDVTRQPEQVKAFRDTWELGIHSYLGYLRDRLTVARELLTESGSCFVQIGDENVHRVRALMDEVFGDENFCGQIAFRTKIPLRTTLVPQIYDHLIWYGRSIEAVKFRRLFTNRGVGQGTQFTSLELPGGERRTMTAEERSDSGQWPANARAYRLTDLVSAGRTESCVYPFEMAGREFFPGGNKSWKTNREGMERLITAGRVEAPGSTPGYVFFANDYPVTELDNVWTDTQGATDREK